MCILTVYKMNITLTEVNFTVETRFEEFTTPELGGTSQVLPAVNKVR